MSQAIFGLSILMSFVSCGVIARVAVWPRLRSMERDRALAWLLVPHLFRFIGLSFLVPGVVSASLPAAFAVPAAYGDLIACILAFVALVALSKRVSWAIPAVWVFNVWGAADLLYAFYTGPSSRLEAGDLGAAFYIPTAVVPLLLVSHLLIFLLLVRARR